MHIYEKLFVPHCFIYNDRVRNKFGAWQNQKADQRPEYPIPIPMSLS